MVGLPYQSPQWVLYNLKPVWVIQRNDQGDAPLSGGRVGVQIVPHLELSSASRARIRLMYCLTSALSVNTYTFLLKVKGISQISAEKGVMADYWLNNHFSKSFLVTLSSRRVIITIPMGTGSTCACRMMGRDNPSLVHVSCPPLPLVPLFILVHPISKRNLRNVPRVMLESLIVFMRRWERDICCMTFV